MLSVLKVVIIYLRQASLIVTSIGYKLPSFEASLMDPGGWEGDQDEAAFCGCVALVGCEELPHLL